MITAQVVDAGTRAVVARAAVPGMDECHWAPLDFEHSTSSPLDEPAIAAQLRASAAAVSLAPWPLPFRQGCRVDYSDRYRSLAVRLHAWDQDGIRWAEAPGGRTLLYPGVGDLSDRRDTLDTAELSVAEVQAQVGVDPTGWLRLPFGNEAPGCSLASPLSLRWFGMQASRFALSLDDNDYFTPFDLTHPERYGWSDDAGAVVDGGAGYAASGDRSRLALYLRPRRWKLWVRTIAHFYFVQGYWEQAVDEVYMRTYWDRPPFYPYRQYVALTASQQVMPYEWFGGLMLAYDTGIDWEFCHSRTAGEMRTEIVNAQWWDLCSAYVLTGVEPAVVVVQREAPRVGETVLGVGRIDEVSGRETRVWATQLVDAETLYPRTTIGSFYSDFF